MGAKETTALQHFSWQLNQLYTWACGNSSWGPAQALVVLTPPSVELTYWQLVSRVIDWCTCCWLLELLGENCGREALLPECLLSLACWSARLPLMLDPLFWRNAGRWRAAKLFNPRIAPGPERYAEHSLVIACLLYPDLKLTHPHHTSDNGAKTD